MNNHQIIGHLGRDAETLHFENGKSVTKFSVATSNAYKNDRGEWVDTDPDWHEVVCWNWVSEKTEHLKKGNKVFVRGKVTRRYHEKENGEKRLYVETVASQVDQLVVRESSNSSGFMPKPGDSLGNPQVLESPFVQPEIVPDTDDDIPF